MVAMPATEGWSLANALHVYQVRNMLMRERNGERSSITTYPSSAARVSSSHLTRLDVPNFCRDSEDGLAEESGCAKEEYGEELHLVGFEAFYFAGKLNEIDRGCGIDLLSGVIAFAGVDRVEKRMRTLYLYTTSL